MTNLQIQQFPCLSDNYGFLLHDPDSGETDAVETLQTGENDPIRVELEDWIDSLDEAVTSSVIERGAPTIVSVLLRVRAQWPPWIRLVATSRPGDKKQHRALDALTGDARIDVTDTQNNGNDLRQYVTMMLQKTSRLKD